MDTSIELRALPVTGIQCYNCIMPWKDKAKRAAYQKQYAKRYRAANIGKVRAYQRKSYHKTKRPKTPEQLAAHAEYMREYRKLHHEKMAAYWAVKYAVKWGHLLKPETCSRCGLHGKIQGHHHNGYSQEHRLDVIWLCRSCHLAEHPPNTSQPAPRLAARKLGSLRHSTTEAQHEHRPLQHPICDQITGIPTPMP